ncbi:nuclear transport factor 2 family protein [Nocardioides daphniae]|uniref:Membrane protein n=1 Tax=Nocardioides daphniae TaxID=402297 RepID=A0A4P7UDP2_9ACTN|nr:nuclear transport factor 2 family protein [Nocardioides daphniae]QCC77671.1 nuclear transport factor 2 family protein [Nocardioides daphniae]GGD29588.1 membrane protein [Nocardioides daphniae]
MDTFRTAVETRDLEAVEDLLADDVVFRSPVAFQPYPGKAVTLAILREVVEVFEGFTYVRELHDEGGGAYVFEATVDGLAITGCDFLTLDGDGRIVDFMVMTRPLKASQALAARMAERYPAIVEAASAWTPRA